MSPTDLLLFLLSWVVISFGAVVSPGPVSAAIVSEAPRHGWRVGPLVATGHAALELVVTGLIAVGLASYLAAPAAQRAVALAGGLMLLYLGANYLRGAWQHSLRLPDPGAEVEPRSQSALFALGIITTVSNPFWYAWWFTVAAGYLSQAQVQIPAGAVILYVAHISADYLWDTLLAIASSSGRRWLSPARYRGLIFITGGFMAFLGLRFIATGLAS